MIDILGRINPQPMPHIHEAWSSIHPTQSEGKDWVVRPNPQFPIKLDRGKELEGKLLKYNLAKPNHVTPGMTDESHITHIITKKLGE